MLKNQTQFSRKASHGRGDQVSAHSASQQQPAPQQQAASPQPFASPQTSAPQEQPAGKPVAVIKLGVDTHGGQYTFARMIDHQGVQPAQKLSPCAFMEFLRKQTALADRVVMVYEAGPYGFALHRQAVAMGVECLVCAPERLSRGRKRVNDKIDARELLSRLDRYLAGNTTALRLVTVPSLPQELARRLGRERNTYRKEQQRWKARGRSLLHTMGIHRPGRWWEPVVLESLLEQIGKQHGTQTVELVKAELQRDREMMQQMGQKLEELTRQIKQNAKEKAARRAARDASRDSSGNDPSTGERSSRGDQSSTAGRARRGNNQTGGPASARRIKGIGDLSGELLDLEMGDWNRFKNRRQVASYTGLCPGEDSSGESRISLSIDKHGNPRVRAILVELAWLLPRFQPNYCRLKRWRAVLEGGSRAMRKKAVVALARQLAVDLWRIKTGRVRPEALGLEQVPA